jgi:hypothetical protein
MSARAPGYFAFSRNGGVLDPGEVGILIKPPVQLENKWHSKL